LTAADDHGATLLLDDGAERTVPLDDVDKARTVFEWGPKPKPGKQPSRAKKPAKPVADENPTTENPTTENPTTSNPTTSNKEKQAS
jgi:ribosome maturation factor RimP